MESIGHAHASRASSAHSRLRSWMARRSLVRAALGMIMVSVVAATTLLASPAYAAPGDPFPAGDALVFVAQNTPSQLFRATTDSAGTVSFAAEGPAAGFNYNAIGYNTVDNYLYGTTGAAVTGMPQGSLVRIGQGGVVTRVGTATFGASIQNTGAFGSDNFLYVLSSGNTAMTVINVATGTLVRTVTLSTPSLVSDMTFANGFFWGVSNGTDTTASSYVRINPTTGAVTRFPTTLAGAPYGAAWTFGNGNLGFSNNTTGAVSQVRVTNPASTAPTFTVLATSAGPASSANDGAASPGQPTDLAIDKTGPAALIPGGTVTYTLTVTNNGPGNSTGFVVNDTVPAPLTNIASPNAACTVVASAVRCVGGRLVSGASVTYTITASVPGTIAAGVTNTATVVPNEADPTPGNNTDTTTAVIARLSLLKRAGTPVDVNRNGITDAGDTIRFSFDVTNTGDITMSGLVVNDPKVGAVTCPATTLAAGAVTTCSSSAYTITAADATLGSVNNTATATGTTPDNVPVTTTPSSTTTPVATAAPGISIVKSVVPAGFSDYVVGQTINYSFLVTNTGNVPLNTVTVNEVAFTGSAAMSAVQCPAGAATLAVAAQITCTASYVATQADVDAGALTNTATASGTPPGGTLVTSQPSSVQVTTTTSPAISLTKSVSPTWIMLAGQSVTYSFVITNTGNVTLRNVAVAETAFSGTGTPPVISCPAAAASLAPAQSVTCTAGYVATQADVDAREITNTAVATGTPVVGAGVTSSPSSAEVSVFVVTLPLTGGTSTEQVLLLGGSGVLISIVMAIWHRKHTRRRRVTTPRL
jgi:uncharacterized repeat protein (TIGR01451 family)